MQFDNTRIYPRALELLALTRDVVQAFPRGYSFLTDQLLRASSSVVQNFAEGYGKSTPRDQRRYFVIARGSACEMAAAFDVALTFGLISPDIHARGRDLSDHLARMLTRFRR